MTGEAPDPNTVIVDPREGGQKLLQFLQRRLDLPPSLLHRWIRTGQVRINGGRAKPFGLVAAGDSVRLPPFALGMSRRSKGTGGQASPEQEPRQRTQALPPAPRPLQKDGDLWVFCKPAGLPTHPGTGHEDSLSSRLAARAGDAPFKPTPVHRLDKDTSGLLLVALDEPTRLRMSEAFARREVHKEYLALVQGVPPQTGTCREPLGRHPTAKVKMAVVPEKRGGKAAHSDWRVLWSSPRKDFSLVAVRIHTGRTHQIRVHMAHVGHPLLGDALYAPAPVAARAPRQMLHAWHISFCHPLSGEALEFFCPPPDDMLRTILNNSSRMQRLVITGNPGCGKSTLTHALEEAGLPTVSADALVAQLYAAGGEMADYLGRRFGERLLEDDGSVCKPALLEAMQQDPGLRKEVEQMVHALVRDAILAFWDKAEAGGKNCAVAESGSLVRAMAMV